MTLKIRLLGGFNLAYSGQAVDSINSPRLHALLAYLLLHRDTPQLRQQVAFHFWPVSRESQAHTNLRKLFLQLRRALPDEDQFLYFDNQTIQWQADAPFVLDVAEVQHLLKILADNPGDQEVLTRLLNLYTGQLQPSGPSSLKMGLVKLVETWETIL